MLKKFYMALITILCSLGITIAISYAWFLNDTNVDPIAQGMAGTAYFAYGDGSSENKAYGINTPRHLYNLAWLSYLYPNQYANKYYEIDPTLQGSLNMYGWTLPPIGKDNSPFTGFFNGKGKTITNLTISNDISSMSVKPNTESIPSAELNGTKLVNATSIGFFGNISGDGTTQVHDFYLDNAKIETKASSTCAGIVAGYVDGKIENVGVISSGLDLGNMAHSATHGSNVSDYTVVGYATENYTTTVANSKTVVYNATTSYDHFNYRGMGSATAWGGSINMTELYNRIVTLRPAATSSVPNSVSTYPSSQIAYVNFNNDSITPITTSSNFTSGTRTYVVRKMGGADGTYLKRNDSDRFNYLTSLYADTLIVTKSDSQISGETIRSSNGLYLNVSSQHNNGTLNFSVSINSSSENPTIWVEEGTSSNIHLYTYNSDDGYKYYLSLDSSYNLTLENEDVFSGTSWQWDSTANTYKNFGADNRYRYLKCINNDWTVKDTFVITDGTNYLVNNNGTIDNTTSIENATIWICSESGSNPQGYFTDVSNDSMVLTYTDNTLTVNDTGSYWNNDGSNIFSGTKVIKFDGTNWVVEAQNTFKIQCDGGHYLRYNGSFGDTNTANNGTNFTLGNTLSNATGNGKISFTYNNQTYYLSYNNGLTTSQENQASIWYHDQHGIYYNNKGTMMYLQYSGGWKAQQCVQKSFSRYYIRYGMSSGGLWGGTTNYYLTRDNTTIDYSTSPSESNLWIFSQAATNPSGIVYQISGGYYYYLQLTSSGPIISTTTPHTFSNSNGYLYDETSGYFLAPNVTNSIWGNSFNGWTTSTSQPTRKPSYTTGTNLSVDDYENTPFASFGVYTGYISRCDIVTKGNLTINNDGIESNVYFRELKKEPSLFTYIPLLVNDDNSVKSNNTGYIISGGYSGSSLTGQDIRVSYYPIESIENSYNGNITDIYTCGYDSNGNRRIDKIGSTYFPTESFSKYNSSITDFDGILDKDSSKVYGLHFMDAAISKSNLVRLPKATISDDSSLVNYQMPEDCIDFKLKQKGLINFYAGYYFYGTSTSGNTIYNDSFFSLHEIIRNEKNYIIAINHIDKIYGKYKTVNGVKKIDLNVDFIYKYVDASEITGKYYSNNSNSAPDGYDVLFDRDWIENGDTNSTYRKNIFYFEIPVNEGEFALGSVSGKNGAYLMYLDIGANASIVDRTQISQETVQSISRYVYPNGIQVVSTNDGVIDAHNTFTAIIPAGTYNTISLNSTSITGANLNMSYNGTGGDITGGTLVTRIRDGDTHYLTEQGSFESSTNKVLKYFDYNNGRDRLYEVTVLQVDDKSPTYSVYCIFKDNQTVNTLIEDTTSDDAEYGLLVKGTGANANYGVAPTSVGSVISNASFRSADSDKILEYYFEVLADYNSITQECVMNHEEITTLYKVNGITISSGANKLEQNDYYLQHVYRMTGNTITVAITAPSGATTTDYDSTIKISVYEPNKVEATGDDAPGYIFTINGTPIASTSTTIDVTATAAT